MKKITYMILAAAMAAGGASCSKETPFEQGREGDGYGRVLTSSLTVEVKTDEKLVRASAVPEVEQFMVEFYDTTDDATPVESYTYGDMPEVVTLPVGTYTARAYYGGDYGSEGAVAAFDAPYYLGTSEKFTIEKDKIVDNIKPITCKLANVKVTIFFDQNLVSAMSGDSKVSVKVGDSGSLDFTPATNEDGYFAYVEGSTTLAATFTGVIDGDEVLETKTYDNVQPGNYYKITFKLHTVDPNEPGYIEPGEPGKEVSVDASVTIKDMTGDNGINVNPGDEIILDDENERPKEDPINPKPDDPTPPTPGAGPSVTAEDPINLDEWNLAYDGLQCVLNVHSDTGITKFTVKIDSETLTSSILSSVGLADSFDLITATSLDGENSDLSKGLADLKLPIKDEVLNQKAVKFDVSQFMGLLGIYGAADHKFILTVADSSGESVVVLKLRTE